MSVIVATAYMDEAERFDWLAAMDDGKVIASAADRRDLRDMPAQTSLEAGLHRAAARGKAGTASGGGRQAARRPATARCRRSRPKG